MHRTLFVVCLVFLGCGFSSTGKLDDGAPGGAATTAPTTTSHTGGAPPATDTTSTTPPTSTGSGGATTTTSSSTTGHGGTMTTGSGGATSTGGAAPVDAGPTTYASCKERHDAVPTDPTGVYELTPAMGPPYLAFCEMAADGGGWTLVLKIDGHKTTFDYEKMIWTNDTPFQEDAPNLDTTEAKLPSFYSVALNEVRMGMIDKSVTRWAIIAVSGGSLLDVMGGHATTNLSIEGWEGLLESGSIQTKCNMQGINVLDRVRIGLLGDESDNCVSPDSYIGFGGSLAMKYASGNFANWYPDHGDRYTKTFGYVMVR